MSTLSVELDAFDPAPAPRSPLSATPMLVCASEPGLDEPHVVLADGVYETARERVFWRGTPRTDALRLPLDTPVTTRPTGRIPRPSAEPTVDGELALLKAIQASRAAQSDPMSGRRQGAAPATVGHLGEGRDPISWQLVAALEVGDADLAYAHAVLLWRQSGLSAVYQQMSRCLADLASSWAAGTGSVLAEHRATRTVGQVTERLTALTAGPTRCGTVILAVPEGEQHTVVLTVLAHLLREAGRPVQVVDALPHDELLELVSAPGTTAVLLSLHTPMPGAALRSLLRDLRTAGPDVLLAVGGPGLPPTITAGSGADLLGDDVHALLRALDNVESTLTQREAQILGAVADGLTNNDIARLLGVSPTTVKSHLDNIFTKTRTEHRAAAVARALRRGWIS